VATAAEAPAYVKRPTPIICKLVYPAALAASLSIWLLALGAPLWLDETLSYWQVSGGFAKVWTRSQLMPSSIGYLYTLWFAKSILGTREIALKTPSLIAMLGAVYFLFRSARELYDPETAFLAAIFFALQYNVVFAATDARPYAFALLATNIAIFCFIRWIKQLQMKRAILSGAAAAGILYFHYLFAAILPAFAIYYLAARGRYIKSDARQLAAVLASFTFFVIPLIYRVASLYRTKETHVVQEMLHPVLVALNTVAPLQILIGFVITAFLAAPVRRIRFPGRESFPTILLFPLLAVVPAGVLAGVSSASSVHFIIPRYFSVVAPGSALTWALLTRQIDSSLLRRLFCVGLVGITIFETFSSPLSRKHELSFKYAHEFVNANVASSEEKVPVLVFSAFIESDYEPMPNDPTAENPLLSQVDYYRIHAPVVMLPMDLNDEAMRIGTQTVLDAARRHQRFLVVAAPTSFKTVNWLVHYSRGSFTARTIGEFDQIAVVEFRPIAGGE
jgi:Dolichyl-phosphate-mannose-protein mannosyltransferase